MDLYVFVQSTDCNHVSVLCAGNPWIARTRMYVPMLLFFCLFLFEHVHGLHKPAI